MLESHSAFSRSFTRSHLLVIGTFGLYCGEQPQRRNAFRACGVAGRA